MNEFMTYITEYWAPLSGMLIGLLIVAFFILLKTRWKKKSVQWVARVIFRNQIMSEKSAESLFNVVTSFLLTLGGLWIILALLFLHIL